MIKPRNAVALMSAAALAGAALAVAPASSATSPQPVAAASARISADPTPDAQALQRTLEQAPAQLRTPFEISNGTRWTTVEEAQEFRRALDESSDRVRVERVGESGQGRPIELVSVGYPSPEPLSAAAEGSVVLFDCSIHGDEPSGREGCLQVARDMSSTTNPAWLRLLSSATVLFININPDGWAADTRGNANGIDVNRDFLSLETPEAQALATVMRDWNPDILNDLHEFGPREFYDTRALVLWPRNRNVDSDIHELSQRMVDDYTSAQIESLGFTTGIYGELVKDGVPFLQIAGDHQARILRNYTGLKHITGQLTETASEAVTPEEENDFSLLNRNRVAAQYASAVGSMSMMLENRSELATASSDAKQEATEAGAAQSGVLYFAGQDNMLPTSADDVEPHPMCGYQLSGEQLTQLQQNLQLHGITWQENEDGAFVTMAQPGRPLIPLLLDERAEYGLTAATPVPTC